MTARVCRDFTLGMALVAALSCAAPSAGEPQQRPEVSPDTRNAPTEHAAARDDLAQRAELEAAIGELVGAIYDTVDAMEERRRQLQELTESRDVLQYRLQRARQLLERQLQSAYAMGRTAPLRLLLNQGDAAGLGRMLVYYAYLNRARSRQIAELQASLAQLASVEDDLAESTRRLAALQAQQSQQKMALKQAWRRHDERLSALQATTAAHEQRSRDQQNQRLQSALGSLRRAMPAKPAHPLDPDFSAQKGWLPWPVAGRISASFGAERGSAGLQWSGVHIRAPLGRPVRAISRGRVAFADTMRGFGRLVVVDHGDGYMSLYGYNRTLNVEVGHWVEAGEAIAVVGTSDLGNGLYFAIRHQGRALDPARWCLALGGSTIGRAAAGGAG